MYSIKKVSELLGIPTVTLRAWENRYQLISPARSSGGHRLYSEEDIEILKWIKHQIEDKGMKVSEAVWLWQQGAAESKKGPSLELPSHHKAYRELIERLYLDLIAMNTMQAHKTIDLAFTLFHYEEVFHHLLAPVLYRIGDEWETGRITVAQEHFSSQLIMQRCSDFLRVLPVQPHLPSVLAMCPEGENHQIGLMLFSLFLRIRGVDVTYLGPGMPLHDLISLIKWKNISVLAISLTDPRLMNPVRTWIKRCQGEFPQLSFVLGGKGFVPGDATLFPYILSEKLEDWEKWFQAAFGNVHHPNTN